MEQRNNDIGLFRRILQQASPYKYKIISYFFLSLLATPLALLAPIPLKIVVDNVIGNQPLPQWLDFLMPSAFQQSADSLLLFSIVFFLIIAVVTSLQSLYCNNILQTKITQNLILDFRSKLLNHSQKLSIGFHDTKGVSHTSYRLYYDTFAIQQVIFSTIIPMISAVVTFISMFYIIMLLDSTLALVALVVSPLIVFITSRYRKPLRGAWRHYKKADKKSLSIIDEVLNMLRVVKAFGRENYEGTRFLTTSRTAIQSRMKVEWLQAGLTLLLGLTTAIGTVLVLYLGTVHVLEGVLSLGNLLVIMSYLKQLYGPMQTFGKKIASVQSYLASAERAFELIDHPTEVIELKDAKPIRRVSGAFTFENVSFSYNKRDPILQNINFAIAPGTRVGIAGRTGAGKTTLLNLLFRFYDPDTGRILLDGQDIKNYRLDDLRRQYSIVLQDALLFSSSISENIAYGVPNCTEGDIIRAAKLANAHAFIEKLPEGYNTLVGEKGMRLSGGERQRIALARAFISDAPILVLDEPTSSVDIKTETAIVESMEKVMSNRTTFIIAHRLSTLESCDLLLIIEDGKIVKSTTDVFNTVRNAILDGTLVVDAKGEIVDH